MRAGVVYLNIFCVMAVFLSGCTGKNDRVSYVLPTKVSVASVYEAPASEEFRVELPEEEEIEVSEEPVEYRVMDVTDLVCSESEIDVSLEDGESRTSDMDRLPEDTAENVESGRITSEIIETEKEVETVLEIPIEYTDGAGNVRYAFLDGVWYDYRYSSEDITMPGERNDEEALFLLNLFGEYDDFEVAKIECVAVEGKDEEEYTYHVLYRKARALSEPPEIPDGMIVTKTRREMVTKTEKAEEKVPLTGMQVIKGVRLLFDEDGTRLSVSGIGVTGSNGIIDWKKVRGSGMDFAMIRCGYRGAAGGMLVRDSRFEENVKGALGAGMEVYLYFYSQAVTEKEAVEEASFIVSMAEKYRITTPVVISTGYTKNFNGRADGLSREDRTACVEAFVKTVKSAGYTAMIGADRDWLTDCLDLEGELKDCPIWLTEYNSDHADACDIWRYTGKGIVDGTDGPVALCMKYK